MRRTAHAYVDPAQCVTMARALACDGARVEILLFLYFFILLGGAMWQGARRPRFWAQVGYSGNNPVVARGG